MTVSASVLLVDPKYAHNVGGALRACAVFGADSLGWSGRRVPFPAREGLPKRRRLPREERMKDYEHVRLVPNVIDVPWFLDGRAGWGRIPVAVEVRDNAEQLCDFVHPADAVYVFGPEDGTLGRGVLGACHRFVVIPTVLRTPLNLAAAVNVVLYDRTVKEMA